MFLAVRRITCIDTFQIAKQVLIRAISFQYSSVDTMPKRCGDETGQPPDSARVKRMKPMNVKQYEDPQNEIMSDVACRSVQKSKKGNTIKDRLNQRSIHTKRNEDVHINTSNVQLSSKRVAEVISKDDSEWDHVDYLNEHNKLDRPVAATLVKLFDDDNTVPFIARYRKHQTCGLDADQLRIIKECYDRVKVIKHKAEIVLRSIEKAGQMTPELERTVKSMRTLNELEHIHSLYKVGAKKTLADKARELDLEPTAQMVLQGGTVPHLKTLVKSDVEGLQNEERIKNGVVNILADIISKDKRTFDEIKELRNDISMRIQTKKTKESETSKSNDIDSKYAMYYDWSSSEKYIKSHQILAINRAESEKVITAQIIIPDSFEFRLKKSISQQHEFAMNTSSFHRILIVDAFHQAYKKSVKPAIARRVRNEMNEKAQEESMGVFSMNVKQLLLTSPVRGKVVIGIDPGFAHGCKLAVVSKQGDALETTTIYPHGKNGKSTEQAADVLVSLVHKHTCSVLALGNGTACRETESFLSDLVKSGRFGDREVTYTIVDEAGASIYSCSDEAKSEFPNMDYNVISAVSIARRLQDPLAELVKIEPKHLGVGMYQHDLPPKQLMAKLNETVTEVVSFVGVDINTASKSLLRRVAGLSESRAASIIQWRQANGSFFSRDQVRKVKGVGPKTFEQCAGFIRVMPETTTSKLLHHSEDIARTRTNYLDQTWIHPESYRAADAFVKACKLDLNDLGSAKFINKVRTFANQDHTILSQQLQVDVATLEIIIDGLSVAKGEDIRGKDAPIFRKSLRSIGDLIVGSSLSGEVRNVTHFGAFVDVGVGRNGLIHIGKLAGEKLKIGQRVDVRVESIEQERGRIGLTLMKSY